MKKFIYLLLGAGLVYGVVNYVPHETKQKTLAAIGLSDFFQKTVPGYLREKLSIPENSVAKRKRLLDQLNSAIGDAKQELEAVLPQKTSAKTSASINLPRPKELQEKLEKGQEYLVQTEILLEELKKANPGENFFQKVADRVLDKIIPPQELNDGTSGVGGDVNGGAACPKEN